MGDLDPVGRGAEVGGHGRVAGACLMIPFVIRSGAMNTLPNRIAHLRAYFLQLAADAAARGAFRVEATNRIEAAAGAVLVGGTAMAEQFFEDVKALAGDGAQLARPFAEGVLAGELERGARKAAEWFVGAVTSRFDGRAAQQKVGEKCMNFGKK